jgi:branched-chain amino acid transport system ATP-binding protein
MTALAQSSAPSPNGVKQAVPLLAARSVSIGYSQIPVVRDLDLEVHEGEIVALLGANGAGKTTTLLGMAGELPPISGHVEYLGERITSPLHVRAKQGFGYVPEERSCASGAARSSAPSSWRPSSSA